MTEQVVTLASPNQHMRRTPLASVARFVSLLHAGARDFTVADVVSVQLLIEGAMAAELASAADTDTVVALRQIVDDMDDASLSSDELLELELRLHQALAEHSGNKVVAAILTGLLPAIRSYLRSGAELTGDRVAMSKRLHAENRSIVDAIEQGDVVGASIGMRDHIAHRYARL